MVQQHWQVVSSFRGWGKPGVNGMGQGEKWGGIGGASPEKTSTRLGGGAARCSGNCISTDAPGGATRFKIGLLNTLTKL